MDTKVEKMLEWVEPFNDHSDPVYLRVSESTAIRSMQDIHPELTDEQALDEFIVVHWAYFVDENKAERTTYGFLATPEEHTHGTETLPTGVPSSNSRQP